jgi:homoaconitase
VLPLWFVDQSDYGRIGSGDVIETIGLEGLLNGASSTTIKLRVFGRDKSVSEILTKHTMSSDQLKWLRAGSALNYIRTQLE